MLISLSGTLLVWLIAGTLSRVLEVTAFGDAGSGRRLEVTSGDHRTNAIEFLSSGAMRSSSLVDRDAGVVDDPEQQELPWPQDALSSDEHVLATLEGSSNPEKVGFPEGVFVRKTVSATDSSAIMMEALANELYAVAGVKAPRCRYYPQSVTITKDYMLCRWIEGLKPMAALDRTSLYHASANFVLDAMLENYDIWGRTGNLGLDGSGNMVRIDNGGSLATTGQGEWKPTVYNCDASTSDRLQTWSREPFTLWDMRSSGLNTYAHVTVQDIHGEALSVLRKKALFLKAIDNFNSTTATKRVRKTLETRLECLARIIKHKVDLLGQVSQSDTTLPKEVCEGVRSVCHELLVDYL